MDLAQRYPNLHVSRHPLVAHKLSLLRDRTTEPKKFRELVRELSWLLGYEAMADLSTQQRTVEPPPGPAGGGAPRRAAHPDVAIHVGAVDRALNERGYIVPGLGDAGDRQFGTFAGPASEPGDAVGDETAEVVRRLQRNLAEEDAGQSS